jgi:hypothetical protein
MAETSYLDAKGTVSAFHALHDAPEVRREREYVIVADFDVELLEVGF